jgi:hypothetical protein
MACGQPIVTLICKTVEDTFKKLTEEQGNDWKLPGKTTYAISKRGKEPFPN